MSPRQFDRAFGKTQALVDAMVIEAKANAERTNYTTRDGEVIELSPMVIERNQVLYDKLSQVQQFMLNLDTYLESLESE